jgi:hypothetical protein
MQIGICIFSIFIETGTLLCWYGGNKSGSDSGSTWFYFCPRLICLDCFIMFLSALDECQENILKLATASSSIIKKPKYQSSQPTLSSNNAPLYLLDHLLL